MAESVTLKKKICLLGSYGVGKTSLVRRFVFNKFEEKYLSTIGVNISRKTISLVGNHKCEIDFYIWDIANIEKLDSVIKTYLNGSHGAILVSDITRPNTAEQTKEFAKMFLEINPDAQIVFVGNKIDLADGKEFDSVNYVKDFKSFKTYFTFTSAKSGENVETVFYKLAEQIAGES